MTFDFIFIAYVIHYKNVHEHISFLAVFEKYLC